MPHDLNGDELHIGDLVTVRCRVRQIHPTVDFCNLTLETTERLFPGDQYVGLTVNAKQTVKVPA
jgi:hypothetical protein